MNQENEECCPKFNPENWDEKTFEWNDKKFIKDKVFTLFYMPINFGSVIKKLMNKIDSVKATCTDGMILSDHTSKWNMDLYLAVDKNIPNSENISISGKFFSKVYEGNFKDTNKWIKDFDTYLKTKNMITKKNYMRYTTCPKCAKKYGKNYVVIFARI